MPYAFIRTSLADFQTDNIYKRFDRDDEEVEMKTLTGLELEDYLYNTIATALGPSRSAKLDRKVDLFSFGVDSLQATRIRNSVQKEIELGGHSLSQTGAADCADRETCTNTRLVVYEHPSVEKLASFLTRLKSGDGAGESQHETKMLALLNKWIVKVGRHSVGPNAPSKPVDARVIVSYPN